MLLYYVRLRGGFFSTRGYNLELNKIAPQGIQKTSDVLVHALDRNHKMIGMERLPGTAPRDEDGPVIAIPAYPYADEKAAQISVLGMCENLAGALLGDDYSAHSFYVHWATLLDEGMKRASRSADMRVALLANLYGTERLAARFKSEGPHEALNPRELVREALQRRL